MLHILAVFLTALSLLPGMLHPPVQTLFQCGQLLRMHVVAHDDTPAMQQAKLAVRDAVRTCYAENADGPGMEKQVRQLLPLLEDAACTAARSSGFDGQIRVTLERRVFPDSQSGALNLPRGEYPALMIRMGDAQGRNWWGLIDPELSLWFARLPGEADAPPSWDWSVQALLRALFGTPRQGA